MQRRSFIKKFCAACIVTSIGPYRFFEGFKGDAVRELQKRFQEPQITDSPQVYWFWMNGHISKEGITLDLEAMKRVGIGGVFNFDAGISIPKGPVTYLSKEWLALKQHAIQEAKRLGLEFVLHNCPGWSSSGGPWITPELAMQQVTWSEVVVNGGKSVSIQLPVPFHKLDYYRDIAVLAYPSLPSEIGLQNFRVYTSSGPVSKKALTGEDPGGVIAGSPNQKEAAWLLFDFEEAQEVRFITFLVAAVENLRVEKDERTAVELQASGDGAAFETIATISTGLVSELAAGYKFITYDIAPTKAKYFRVVSAQPRRISQFYFSGYSRLKNFMEKTGNRFMFSGESTSPVYRKAFEDVPTGVVINSNAVINLSSFVNKEGLLVWDAPEGSWTVLRFGYTVTGAINKAAPENGIGLECDKFSKAALDYHFEQMMKRLGPSIKELARQSKMGLQVDSYEAGPQTWTNAFPEEFERRRGYAIVNYLPVITGRFLDSVDHTERFLWDFRRTQADLVADNYYGRFSELCHQHGFTSYVEPYDKGPFEEMQIGARADVNMGEFWYGLHSLLPGNLAVERTATLAASIMHTNGRKIVAAESFTSEPESSRWQEYPFSLKALGDKMFCHGVNKIIIHRFAHQPNPFAKPGMTMGPWGIHFDRTNTWFEKAGGWLRYMARCQVLLREGWPVKDLVYFTGEEANVYTRVHPNELRPAPPDGYAYDVIDAEAVLNRVRIEDGLIHLPHGITYRIFILQDYKRITFPLLLKLQQLVREGMILVGEKPAGSLGLQQLGDEEKFRKLAGDIWGDASDNKEQYHAIGKGRVYRSTSLSNLLHDISIKPDFEFSSHSGDAPILFFHRRFDDVDVYFLSNQRRSYEELVCTFRVTNKQPQLWNAGNGRITAVSVYEQREDGIRMPLVLEPYGSTFVIFRSAASRQAIQSIKKDGTILLGTNSFSALPRKLFPAVRNNFSLEVWAKPEMNIMTKPSVHMGAVAHPYTDYYAIYPSCGKCLYGDGHAICGLTIGRNGVGVWENETYPVLALVAETPIAGWSHIALVYDEGVPIVYINGQRIKKGIKSSFTIHPGLGHVYLREGASFFNGDMQEPKLFTEVLRKEQVRLLAQRPVPSQTNFPSIPGMVSYHGKAALLLWENGRYELQNAANRKMFFAINAIDSPVELTRSWQIAFPPNSGAPDSIELPKLHSLHTHQDAGVKYFSGTAIYRNQFASNSSFAAGTRRLFLDLGRVEVVAQVMVNGKEIGTLWKRPYLVDISSAVNKGVNQLEVRVTNLWPNRLIGDEQTSTAEGSQTAGTSGFEHLAGTDFEKVIGRPIREMPDWYVNGQPQPANGPVTFATWKHYAKQDPLLESGLIGPVFLRTAVIKPVEP